MEGDRGHHEHGHASAETPSRFGPAGHGTIGGVSVAANGLRLVPDGTRFDAGLGIEWTFRIVDDRGTAVTGFDAAHGELAHLIVVRRDLSRFQHRHPELDADGTWRISDLVLPDPGVYRAFVDVVVDGRPTTLGFDLFASGSMTVEDRPGSSRQATTGGYVVELLTGDIEAGEPTELEFEIRRDGDPVPRLGPYLGALGHLVALREGDLGYLHVHPDASDPTGGRVAFGATFPTPGRYRLFLQAKPEDELITTRFDTRIDM